MTWSLTNPPLRPGHYLNFKSKPSSAILPSAAGTVFVPFTADWGPFKTIVQYDSFQEFLAVTGDTVSPGLIAVKNAFKGEMIDGFPGAGTVLGYRTGSSSAHKASKILQNSTPANALTLTALYEGTNANTFTVTVQTNAADNTKKDLLLYDGSILLENYIGVDPADMATLASLINAQSGWMVATVGTDGTALANVTNSAFTGGNDGSTLISSDWTDVMAIAATREFAVFAPYDLTDSSIQAALLAWEKDQNNNKGRRFMVQIGGAANETVTTAVARSAAMNDENVCNLGVGSYTDTTEPDWPNLSTSQLAPRLAGILAARGIYKAPTYCRFAGLAYATGVGTTPDETAIVTAIQNGLMVIGSDSHPLSALRVELGLTTYTTKTDLTRTFKTFSPPKFVLTMHEFERQMKHFAIEQVITPSLPVNKDTREFVLSHARLLLSTWEGSVIKEGSWKADISQNPPPSDTDNFINIDYQWTFARSTEQVRGTAYVL